MAPYEHRQPAKTRSSLDLAVATAVNAADGGEATSITFPGTAFATPRHYLVWTHGATPLTSRLFTPVLIDAETGQLSGVERLPWYLRALEVSSPLHFGDYVGLPLKVMWARSI